MSAPIDNPLWRPDAGRIAAANVTAFMAEAGARWGLGLRDYDALHAWSIEYPESFWQSVWAFGEVLGDPGSVVLENGDRMPGARWFPEARLNFARNLLRSRDESDAIVFWGRQGQRIA